MQDAPLVSLDALGSVRTRDGLFQAICWPHRGSGWDVIGPNGTGASVRTKREAYTLVHRMWRDYWAPERTRENNDSRCWT